MYSTGLLFSMLGPLASAAAVKRQNLDITVSDLSMSISHKRLMNSPTNEAPSHGPIPQGVALPLPMPLMHHVVDSLPVAEPSIP